MPLSLFLLALSHFINDDNKNGVVVIGLVFAAMLEPAFQGFLMVQDTGPGFAAAFVTAHILAINLTQLFLLRRFDFMSMFAFRIFYYLIWHVVWGYVRLI